MEEDWRCKRMDAQLLQKKKIEEDVDKQEKGPIEL